MKPQFTGRALTLWPEWCPAFRGVRLRDGTPSTLDKGPENRPMAPWSTIAPGGPFNPTPGAWFAMHAGKYIGGRAGNDGALLNVVRTAEAAGWVASRRAGDVVALRKNGVQALLHPDYIVTSAIVAVIRITCVDPPGIGGPWRFVDQFGWYVEVRPLPEPIPCKGAQGLWTVPDAVTSRIAGMLPEVCGG